MRLVIRQAVPPDAEGFLVAKAHAWREAYTGRMPEELLAAQFDLERIARGAARWAETIAAGEYVWLVIDKDADDEIVGLARAATSPDGPTPLELQAIYLRERVKGTGVADALLTYAVGDAPCFLWVLDDNPRARAFYTRHGFAPDGEEKTDVRGFVEVRLVRGC